MQQRRAAEHVPAGSQTSDVSGATASASRAWRRLLLDSAAAAAAACVLACGGPASATAAACTPSQLGSHAQQSACSQPQQPDAAPAKHDPVAEVAGLFGGNEDLEEPVDSFTLYGTTFKKFSIDKLDGEKIVSRRRGFTVETCTAAVAAAQETPRFQGLPTGARVNAIRDRTCRGATGAELKPACSASCRDACEEGLAAYASESREETGFKVSAKAQERVLRGCRRQCSYECAKPGKVYDFSTPYRQ